MAPPQQKVEGNSILVRFVDYFLKNYRVEKRD